MPQGQPNFQTKVTDKYQKKVGVISKSIPKQYEVFDNISGLYKFVRIHDLRRG